MANRISKAVMIVGLVALAVSPFAAFTALTELSAQPTPAQVKPAETQPIAGTLRHRIAADRFLRRLEREGKLTPDQAAAVAKVRNGPDVMDDFVAGLPAVKGLTGALTPGDHPVLDWLTTVGKALWDNREAIIQFIMELVKLFAASGQPVPWPPSLFA